MPHQSVSELLQRLPGMGGACLVEQLADGPTNASYLVERDAERWVLRLDKAEARVLGLDRANERLVCEAIATAGLTPPYRYFEGAEGVSLRPFIAGRSLRRDDLLEPRTLQRLADVLRRLHRLPPVGAGFDVAGAVHRYAAQLATPQAAALAEQAAALLAEIGHYSRSPALCHNDLVAENILQTAQGDLLLIDWEYAALGDPYFDLAVVVRHHELSDLLAHALLSAYLEGADGEQARLHLHLQCDFYSCLLALWNLRVGPVNPA
jgi:thiamine kinase